MRAGLLKEVVTFLEPRIIRTKTGSTKKDYDKVLTCRAHKRKFSNVTDKDKVEALKEFYGHFGIFQVRFHPKIHEDQILEWRGQKYQIILLDPQPDNSYLINVNKLNE